MADPDSPNALKRKADEEELEHEDAKKAKADPPPPKRRNNAIYVTSLPDDVTEEELYEVFSRFGVISESVDDNKPRIKIYLDDDGKPKGDALIIYHRPESVNLAIAMLDETDFRLGQKQLTGPMRVTEADQSYKSQKNQPLSNAAVKSKGSNINKDRQKVIKKNEQLNSRLADWDDDEPQTLPQTSSRWDKVVVIKHMFTPSQLVENPEDILDIKQDVRDEAEKFGTVTNVVLYEQEEDGVVTVRFTDPIAARACAKKFDGRWFDKRTLEAYIASGKEKFKKNKKQSADDEDEAARLESFSNFIEQEQDEANE